MGSVWDLMAFGKFSGYTGWWHLQNVKPKPSTRSGNIPADSIHTLKVSSVRSTYKCYGFEVIYEVSVAE